MFVDTGATYSIVPPALARKIGLVGLKRLFKLGTGTYFSSVTVLDFRSLRST